jgi:hypothetical protein
MRIITVCDFSSTGTSLNEKNGTEALRAALRSTTAQKVKALLFLAKEPNLT